MSYGAKLTLEDKKEIALYYAVTESTIRKTAKEYGCAKNTVMRAIKTMEKEDQELFKECMRVLNKNKLERSFRGGNATKIKYKGVMTY